MSRVSALGLTSQFQTRRAISSGSSTTTSGASQFPRHTGSNLRSRKSHRSNFAANARGEKSFTLTDVAIRHMLIWPGQVPHRISSDLYKRFCVARFDSRTTRTFNDSHYGSFSNSAADLCCRRDLDSSEFRPVYQLEQPTSNRIRTRYLRLRIHHCRRISDWASSRWWFLRHRLGYLDQRWRNLDQRIPSRNHALFSRRNVYRSE